MLGMLVIVALGAGGEGPHSLYMFDDQCVVIDATGKPARQVDLKKLGLKSVTDADVSPDGQRILITAWSDEAKNTVLFEYDFRTEVVRRRGEAAGFHAAPSYSPDGKWLQFAHHPTLGGPVGMHEARAYAQLFRERADGSSAPAQLTTSDGCHMESTSLGERVFFAHSNCRGGRRIEVLSDGKEKAITDFDSHLGEPALSSDGRRLVATRVVGDTLEIVEFDPAAPTKIVRLWNGTRFRDQFRPRYLGSSRDVVFQNGREVYRLERAASSVAVTMLWRFQ